jgi:uncharacterized protein (TIGR03435 family)
MQAITGTSLAILVAHMLCAQSFDVASVKPNTTGGNGIGGRGICFAGGGVSVRNMPLSLVIEQAFEIREPQIIGRPAWLNSDRFDIEAKPESRVARDQCQAMLRQLLADRFQLVTHRETRQLPVYRLLVARNGPKLRKVDPGAPLGIRQFSNSTGLIDTRGTSMPQLAGMLAMTGEVENLVQDGTGLEGYFEFVLKWSPPGAAAEFATGPTLFTALQEQLGLRLEAGKGNVEVLVIDRIQKAPTGN